MLELRTLGGLELVDGSTDRSRAIPLQGKRLALLAYLAAAPPNGYRRRDTVLALFWPELSQDHARGALRQALHFIRKTLGTPVIESRGEEEIGLDPSLITSDASRLEAALEAGDPGLALGLYQGDFLDGVFVADAAPEFEDWIATERARLKGLAAQAAWLASERPATGQEEAALIRRAVFLSGADETALRRGIARLEERGDRAGAAALYEDFAQRVARDLDIELSPETQAVMREMRSRRVSAPAAGPPTGPPSHDAFVSAESAPPSETHRRMPRLLLAAAGAVLLTMALAAYFGSAGSRIPPPSPARVAIVPFRVTEADSSLAWLHEGIVELLAIRIAGSGGPEVASPSWVLAEWDRFGRSGGWDAPPDVAKKVARRVGAGRMIEGAVTGGAGRVTMSAQLSAGATDRAVARAAVEGSADSLPQLVDQLAAQLLGLSAGMEGARLASLTSSSLPAIRAFLRGQAAFRTGRMRAAVEAFREATTLDSAFALAGLRMSRAAMWTGFREDGERGVRIAHAGRARLSRNDRLLLDATSLPDVGASVMFEAWNAAISAAPDNPEVWYLTGDVHFHWGRLAGEDDALERATVAFRRGWLLDSLAGVEAAAGLPIAEPTAHLVALAHLRGDTAAVLRLAAAVLRADSTSDLASLVKWHRASVTSQSARAAYRDGIALVSQDVLKDIHLFILWTGVDPEDLAWLIPEERQRFGTHDPGWAAFTMTASALNGGRPGNVPAASVSPGYGGHRELRNRLRRAMWWDGDSAQALAAAVSLRAFTDSARVSGEGAWPQLYDICAMGEWAAYRGDHASAAAAGRRLRTARPPAGTPDDSAKIGRYTALCAALLEAIGASEGRAPDRLDRLAAADSIARENVFELCCGDGVTDANLQLTRLWEREGDLPRALGAARRRAGAFPVQPYYLSTFLREEGRLALLVADTTGAVRAWRHYLALRPEPEPQLRSRDDAIRRKLAVLERR